MNKLTKANEMLAKLGIAEQLAQLLAPSSNCVRQQINAMAHAIAHLHDTNGAKNHD
jgi:hypothetical protein